MGIKDLLRFMKPYTEPIHIQKYAGKRVGIDAYSWLHKGAYSCSLEINLNSEGDKKFQYINYFMHRINLLKYHKITPVVVFDGGNIPCKAGTENERYRRRRVNKEMAMEKLKEGNVTAATELFQRAISITPSMAHQLIQILKSENVEFLVAPYEADAQLAYLSSLDEEHGGIVAVISEDSDLLAYGCPAIIFKMDRFGNGEEIVLDNVFKSKIPKPSFRNFNKSLFIGMCVLAGCDFLPSIPGIGIAKAHSMVSKYRNVDRVLSVLKLDKRKQMPEDYSASFREAIAVFEHARIYDRNKKKLQHLKPLPPNLSEALGDLDFLGPDIPSTMATAIAEGSLDPTTMEAYDSSPGTPYLPSSQTSEYRNVSASSNEAGSCFSMYSSKSTRHRVQENSLSAFEVQVGEENDTKSCFMVHSTQKKRVAMSPMSNNVMQRQVLKERNFSDEAAALARLATDPKVEKTEETCIILNEVPWKTPDNNPFKKRKLSEKTEEATPTSESGVTEVDVEPSELRCPILASQESVNSKVKVPNDRQEKVCEVKIGLKKSRTSSCKSSDSTNRKGSILNFFSPI